MAHKEGFLILAIIAGCIALPTLNLDQDLSIFFDHTDGSRVVGGAVAPPGSATHMVALSSGILIRSFSCGGSIISPRCIVTAAHCVEPMYSFGSLSGSYRATVGTQTWNLGGMSFSFEQNFTHPHYSSSIIKNDIALLITTTEIPTTDLIAPAPISFDVVGGGVPVRATGWGRIRAGGAISTQLLELYMETLSGEQCVKDVAQAAIDLNMSAPPIEPDLELCTFHSVGKGMCNGDSGSGLMRTDTNELIAAVSWGFPCAIGAPDMFVRFSTYREFVLGNCLSCSIE